MCITPLSETEMSECKRSWCSFSHHVLVLCWIRHSDSPLQELKSLQLLFLCCPQWFAHYLLLISRCFSSGESFTAHGDCIHANLPHGGSLPLCTCSLTRRWAFCYIALKRHFLDDIKFNSIASGPRWCFVHIPCDSWWSQFSLQKNMGCLTSYCWIS